MKHAYEIRHHADGTFWIWTPTERSDGHRTWSRFIGPFVGRTEAEAGLRRMIDVPVWKYDENGDIVE